MDFPAAVCYTCTVTGYFPEPQAPPQMSEPHSILNNLKVSGNLPSMPQVLIQLIDSCHAPEIKLQHIAAIVSKDAALSAKILQLVNSAFIGARRAFTSVEQSVVYLGADTVKNLAISVSVQQVFRRVETNGLLSIDRFWYHSYRNAILAQRIAAATTYPAPAEAYLAGLLHDIGKLLLWMAFPGRYAPLLLKGVRCHDARLAFLEEEKLHINHCEAGAWLCEQWNLPVLLTDAIRYHHHPLDEVEQALPLTRIAALADLLSHHDAATPECCAAAMRLFHLTPAQVGQLYQDVDEQIARLADELGIHIPRSTRSSHDKEPETDEVHKETSLGLISRVRDITQLTGILNSLLQAGDKGDIIRTVEQAMKILFNEDACLIFLPDGNSTVLRCHASPDNPIQRETEGFRITLDQHSGSLPAQAMQRRHITHSFTRGSKGPANLLDAQLLRLLGSEGMVTVPMIYRKEVQGLLLIGLMEKSHQALLAQLTPLHLLANHAAICFHLDGEKERQEERIVAERLAAANLVARKVAHEINNPVAILRNYISIVKSKSARGDDVREELTIIDQELERIGHISHHLEDLARDQVELHLEPIDLNDDADQTIRLYQASLEKEQRIGLHFTPADFLPVITADRKCLRQIMLNLLGNATDAAGPEGSIEVRTGIHQGGVLLEVENDGPGIDRRLLPDIFNSGVSTKGGKHRGLGLAIVKKLVDQLGGTISCQAGTGRTVFTVTFPT